MDRCANRGVTLRQSVHYDDLDAMGMLHNARYPVLVERAISDFWSRHGVTMRDGRPSHPDGAIAVREMSVSYLSPVRESGAVEIRIWVERLGNTSATYRFAVVSLDGHTVHAEGHRVVIKIDLADGRPSPWSPQYTAVVEKELTGRSSAPPDEA